MRTDPLGVTRLKQGRSGGRQLKKQKLPAEISALGRKRSPANLTLILDSLAQCPSKIRAANITGIHRNTLDYWLKCSAAGHDGYDIEWRGITAKFHEHYKSAMEEGCGEVEIALYKAATGYDEILTYRGHVMYQTDEYLWSLGYRGPEAYLRDKNGNPVPETVRKYDLKTARWLLERLRPEKYGKHRTIDPPQTTGVINLGYKRFPNVEDDSEGEK